MERYQLRPKEKVLSITRRHPLMIILPLVFLFVLLLLDMFFMANLFRFGKIGAGIFFFAAAFIGVAAIRTWLVWKSNVFLVTTHRVIDVDRDGFLSWSISDADLDNIQDISVHKKGILDHILRTGTIEVQTAGSSVHIEIVRIHKPFDVRAQMTDAQDKMKRRLKSDEDDVYDEEERSEFEDELENMSKDDQRAVRKYMKHLKSRKAMESFIKGKKSKE